MVACLESRRSRVRTPLWPSSFKEIKCFFSTHSIMINNLGNLCDREIACSAFIDCQDSNFESSVRRAVSSKHHQEVLLTQFSLYGHTDGLS